ncbi:MAG: hypothetical protein JGK03_01445 [Microcoleus sp. PH2017_25_DOB_D_A]|uniref:hypothetical protein n=1 Tax=unclassified Microcoleus TaxID=2642155 RepID=UPI001DFEE99F|nr:MULTISPECIES: hypothetical protein [unclassified Microcoleus]MCC3437216.1 hypothetical protein [Microcoleus sp. PH2017_05_CCC_O_A]MCC3475710.1 hypothetical protein [Microcoleus sp. PH2017_13_LAR_U_A]MCC3532882.1 hypothetical protein [Microcoleus sp. PH2017_25_DOB_D_A]MCC3567493.1 hypothetical protein [Microcoleus sp. PH2017_31_RDM_U_A]
MIHKICRGSAEKAYPISIGRSGVGLPLQDYGRVLHHFFKLVLISAVSVQMLAFN